MSESPLFVPPFASRLPEPSLPDALRTSDESDLDPEEDARPGARSVREGLPAHYRMRAEPHYVEALARPQTAKAADGGTGGTPRVTPPLERALGQASEVLARTIESISATLDDLRPQGRALRERLLVELARAEAVRAGWLADAISILQQEPLPALDQVNLTAIVDQVVAALGPEHRVTGQIPRLTRPDGPVKVFGDERLLTVAVGGLLQALGACVAANGELGKLELRVPPRRDGPTNSIELLQAAVRLSPEMLARFFEADWEEHPAGTAGAVLLAAARRIATLQGGTLEIWPLDAGGCRVVLGLPAAE